MHRTVKFFKALLAIILFILVEAYVVFAWLVISEGIHISVGFFSSWLVSLLIVLASAAIIYYVAHFIVRLLESVFGK